jgi:hypothetical protein
LKHRRLLVGSIIAIPIGFILWALIGPIVALVGIPSHYGVVPIMGGNEVTTTFWVGVALSMVGLIILIIGVVCIILAFVLEFSDREHKATVTTPTPATIPEPPK